MLLILSLASIPLDWLVECYQGILMIVFVELATVFRIQTKSLSTYLECRAILKRRIKATITRAKI